MSDVRIDNDRLDALLECARAIPGLDDPDVRDARVDELCQTLRRELDAIRFIEIQFDLPSILRGSAACTGGLTTFAGILRRHHPGAASDEFARLASRLDDAGRLSNPDREALCGHLAGIPIIQIAEVVEDLVDASELRSLRAWRDLPVAVRLLEGLPTADDGVPQLLTFTMRLARVVAGAQAEALRSWTHTVAGGLGVESAALAEPPAVTSSDGRRSRRTEEGGLIWGGVPVRNRNFTGRTVLLQRLGEALRTNSKASVLPQTLQGMGGVGKTQLVLEYVYRNIDQYDLVWWVPAERTATVLASLTQLAERLKVPTTEDLQLAAQTALTALTSSKLNWLLVYDNADDPSTLEPFVPSTGGHVVVTTRNQEFSRVGKPIEVDVFERHESIELLRRRSRDDRGSASISTAEADELAEKLGDLPLALEQAATWHLATAMPVNEYIELLDSHIKDLLSEGKPANYPLTVAAFVTLAVERLRETAPATAQLFELFAFLGGEPTAVSLLRTGKDADIVEPLKSVLASAIPTNRTVRDLGRYGLAKVDANQGVQVHRLVQRVLRDSFAPERAEQTLHNVQSLLHAANPGDPDDRTTLDRHRELGPHLRPARMIHAVNVEARQIVLDQCRFLYVTGDYEGSRLLATEAVEAWKGDDSHPRLGPDGLFTLMARGHEGNASRVLGDNEGAAKIARDVYDRMLANREIGPRHDLTLMIGNQIGADLRIAGRYHEALSFDRQSVALHREVFGSGDASTLRAQANLAVDQRMIGDFTAALELDQDIADHWEESVGWEATGRRDSRALAAYINLARDLYGVGAYRAALEVIEEWRPRLLENLGPLHSQVLLAGRTYAIALRKAGRLADAAEVIRDNAERVRLRFGPEHEFSLAAAMSYANVLRERGELDDALRLMTGALATYDAKFPPRHPLTLAARVNEAILRRARHEPLVARELNEKAYHELTEVLGDHHPYTLCAGASLATDLADAGEREAACRLSVEIEEKSAETMAGGHGARDGAEHPDLLLRRVNLSHDLRAVGDVERAESLFTESLAGLRLALGPDHPEVHAVERGARIDGDIEPPPT